MRVISSVKSLNFWLSSWKVGFNLERERMNSVSLRGLLGIILMRRDERVTEAHLQIEPAVYPSQILARVETSNSDGIYRSLYRGDVNRRMRGGMKVASHCGSILTFPKADVKMCFHSLTRDE